MSQPENRRSRPNLSRKLSKRLGTMGNRMRKRFTSGAETPRPSRHPNAHPTDSTGLKALDSNRRLSRSPRKGDTHHG